jgi:predicted GIY-YIG superfamily endonuclease
MNCIYRLECNDCDAVYAGQTSRQLNTRVKEHKRKRSSKPRNATELRRLLDSAIALHALTESHTVNFERPKIVQGLTNYAERLCAESIAINRHGRCLNRKDGANISPIWMALINQWPNPDHTRTTPSGHRPLSQHPSTSQPVQPPHYTDSLAHALSRTHTLTHCPDT